MAFEPENILVVGAGFSFNAGLPLASNFTKQLLNIEDLKLDGPSDQQVRFLRDFVDKVFGEGSKRSPSEWPELEDLFTLIDLSANTGHNLGPDYSAADLRVVRRAIIVRMIRMLSQVYRRRQREPDDNWRSLERLFKEFNMRNTAVLSLNWDTVFERGMGRNQQIKRVDYGCSETRVIFKDKRLVERRQSDKTETLHILKPHGSVNWLYCDACRETFWVPPSMTEKVAQILFKKPDWTVVLGSHMKAPTILSPHCPKCGAQSLGTRFATFSYRKALEFPMHSGSWRTAECYLKRATNWVFLGYSMPAADFEFKHLLKRVQLSDKVRPNITVVTGGKDAYATRERFKNFFGDVRGQRTFLMDGLDHKALDHLRDIKVMKPNHITV